MAYFANGTEGMILDSQCDDGCLVDEPCPIYLVQLNYNYEQIDKGNEKLRECLNHLVDEKGICRMREIIIRNK